MTPLLRCTRTLIALLLLTIPALSQQNVSRGTIAGGTRWATDYLVVDSGKPGPKVMLFGGIHGNEPAGATAAEQIASWTILRGKLIVVPRTNRPGLTKYTRYLPGEPKSRRDLNRNFPRKKADPTKGVLATAIWSFVRAQRPDWLIDLHEGFDFTQLNKKSVGSSVIAARSNDAADRARRMLDTLNQTIKRTKLRFVLKSGPVNGSLARAAFRQLGIPSMIIETTKKKQALSLRTRQHRILVNRLLHDLGMTVDGPHRLARNPIVQHDAKRIAIYDARGTGGGGVRAIARLLRGADGVMVEHLGPGEIRSGALRRFDAVIFPGGSGGGQGKALGPRGRDAVRRFVKEGGGYVGICAGAYLAAQNYSWSLKILDAKVVDRKHWRRGRGLVRLRLTAEGQNFLGADGRSAEIRYANGPIYWPAQNPKVPDYTTLATYASEIAKNGAPSGVMIGTTASARGTYGKGRVICWSPHPELTKGLGRWLTRAVRWAAARD